MKFKNKSTGLTWHITDKDHINRLAKDTGYEQVVEVTDQDDNSNVTTELSEIEWNELRTLATEKGVNTHGKKRKQIEKELEEIGGADDGANTGKD